MSRVEKLHRGAWRISLPQVLWCGLLAVGLIYFPCAKAEPSALAVTGGVFDYSVQTGDSLIKIGARFGVVAEVLARENRLKVNVRLAPGQGIAVDNRHIVPAVLENGLLINLPQRMLYFFRDAQLVVAYPVGLGRPTWQTPQGEFSVINKSDHKTWIVPRSIQEEMRRTGKEVKTSVPPGPESLSEFLCVRHIHPFEKGTRYVRAPKQTQEAEHGSAIDYRCAQRARVDA